MELLVVTPITPQINIDHWKAQDDPPGHNMIRRIGRRSQTRVCCHHRVSKERSDRREARTAGGQHTRAWGDPC